MQAPADFKISPINPVPIKLKRKPPANAPRRKKGQINKITRDIKNGVLTAAENLGRDGNGAGGFIGYLEFVGWRHPKAFCHLLGKCLPLQVNAGGDGTVRPGITLNVVSVESGNYLSSEDIERLRGATNEPIGPLKLVPAPEPKPEPEPSLSALESKLLSMTHEELLALARAVGVEAAE